MHSKLAEAHKLISQGHALLAEAHAEASVPAAQIQNQSAPTETGKKAKKAAPAETAPAGPTAEEIAAKLTPVREKLLAFAGSGPTGPDNARALLAKFGVGKLSELKPDKFDELAAAIDAATAAKTPKVDDAFAS